MRQYLLISCLVTVFTALLAITIFSSFIGENPVSPPFSLKLLIIKVSPQGWGFFTRDPREPVITMYKVDSDESLSQILKSNNSPGTFFGFSRKNRRIHLEFMRLQSLVKEENWQIYKEEGLQLPADYSVMNGDNTAGFDYHYLQEGRYIFFRYKKTPWLYKKGNLKYNNETEFAILDFKLSGEVSKL